MQRRTVRRPLILLGLAGSAFAFTGCQKASETGLEKIIESQGGSDVDLDLNGDGGFSMKTEDGGMSIDEDGNFVITDASGSVVTGNADAETGEFSVETEDGSFSSGTSDEIPDSWPSEVPRPDDLTIISVTSVTSPEGNTFQVAGTVDDVETFIASYVAELEASGLRSEAPVDYNGEESWAAVFEGGYGVILNVVAFDGSDTTVSVMVFPPS